MDEAWPVRVVPDFFDGAPEMRAVFEARFAEPRRVRPDRFVWDFWHVAEQYTYIRTSAQDFFPRSLFTRLVVRLERWGRDHLGCPRIRTSWLSYYVDGCRQELHADVPHGPWAYIFSLTDWDHRGFSGGETLLLEPWCLEYWRHHGPAESPELSSLVRLIPPHFNQLTVLDPRIPHGVRQVEGTRDPVRSRVVIHGWFEEPTLTLSPSLQGAGCAAAGSAALAALKERVRDLDGVAGLISSRVRVDTTGAVVDLVVLSDTLVSRSGDAAAPEAARRIVRAHLGDLRFPPLGAPGWAIVPVRLPVG
jgi:hypothetical protein